MKVVLKLTGLYATTGESRRRIVSYQGEVRSRKTTTLGRGDEDGPSYGGSVCNGDTVRTDTDPPRTDGLGSLPV